jgi:hypothetical protein
MSAEQDMVTIWRSADPSAEDQAAAVQETLARAGLTAVLFTEDDPGVPEGAYEVRVPAAQESRAEQALAERAPEAEQDNSSALDLITVYEGQGTTAELEALSIRALLDSADIPSVLVGTPTIPNLPFRVKAPRSMAEQAHAAIEAAKATGPQAAEAAERATEPSTGEGPVSGQS